MARRSWVALALLLSTSAWGEVVDSAEAGFTVSLTATMPAGADEVFRKATEDVDEWWDAAHTFSGDAANLRIEARAGGCFCEKLGKGAEVRHLEVVRVSPGEMLRLTGGLGPLQDLAVTGVLTLSFEENQGATTTVLTYTVGGYRPGGLAEWAPAVDGVLAGQLERLARYVRTGSPELKD